MAVGNIPEAVDTKQEMQFSDAAKAFSTYLETQAQATFPVCFMLKIEEKCKKLFK